MKLHEIYALIASPYGVTAWRIDTLLSRYQHLFLPLHQTARLPTGDEIEEVLQGIERQRLERNITLAEHSVLRTIVFARVAYEIGKKEAEAAASFAEPAAFSFERQHAHWDFDEWQRAVVNCDTVLGYDAWVNHQMREQGEAVSDRWTKKRQHFWFEYDEWQLDVAGERTELGYHDWVIEEMNSNPDWQQEAKEADRLNEDEDENQ